MENTEMGCNTNYEIVPTNSLHGDVVGTTSSPNQAINEDNILDEKQKRRLVSNRLSARRYRCKKSRTQSNLETKVETYKYQLSELEPLQTSEQIQDQLHDMEEEVLFREYEALCRDELIMNAREKKISDEGESMRQLRFMQLEQMRYQNDSMQSPTMSSCLALPNYDPNLYPVSESGVGTSYMLPEPSQMWVPPAQNMQEIELDNDQHVIDGLVNSFVGEELTAPNPLKL